MEAIIIVLLLLIGIVFFIAELFLIPGTSLAGIAGTLVMGGTVYYVYTQIGLVAGNLALFTSVVLLGIAIAIFLRSKSLDKLALNTEITGKIDTLKNDSIKPGDIGYAQSRLAPMGKVKINNQMVEAKTQDDFIDPGVEVVVLEVRNTNIVVERSNNDKKNGV